MNNPKSAVVSDDPDFGDEVDAAEGDASSKGPHNWRKKPRPLPFSARRRSTFRQAVNYLLKRKHLPKGMTREDVEDLRKWLTRKEHNAQRRADARDHYERYGYWPWEDG